MPVWVADPCGRTSRRSIIFDLVRRARRSVPRKRPAPDLRVHFARAYQAKLSEAERDANLLQERMPRGKRHEM
jgi:hypothetical protein